MYSYTDGQIRAIPTEECGVLCKLASLVDIARDDELIRGGSALHILELLP